MAQRPVGAAHAGTRRAHDDADRDEQHRRDDGGERRASGTGSRARVRPRASEWVGRGGERRRHSTRSRGRSRGVARADSRVPGYALRHAPNARRHARAARDRRRAAARPRRRPAPRRHRPSAGKPSVIPVIVELPAGGGAEPLRVLVPRPEDQPPGGVARPHGLRRVHRARPDRSPGPAVPADVRVGDRGHRAATTWRTRSSRTAGDWKAVFITQAPNKPQEAIGVDFTVLDKATTVGVGQPAPVDDEPDRRGRRRRPREDLERRPSRSGLLPDDRRGRPGGAQAVRARVRDAGVLHECPVRPDARPGQGDRGGRTQGRRVHQRRALQARLRRTASSSRSSTRTASSRRSTPATSGASCPSRGSSPSGRTGS